MAVRLAYTVALLVADSLLVDPEIQFVRFDLLLLDYYWVINIKAADRLFDTNRHQKLLKRLQYQSYS